MSQRNTSNRGGKAVTLDRLVHLGYSVPPFRAIPLEFLRNVKDDPEEWRQLLLPLAKWTRRFKHGVVVRSSFGIEDSDRTFAGVFTSIFAANEFEQIAHAIAACAGSSVEFLDPYRRRRATELDGSVIVQMAVRAVMSGVHFTKDPLGGDGAYTEMTPGVAVGVTGGFTETLRLRTGDGVEASWAKPPPPCRSRGFPAFLPQTAAELEVRPGDYVRTTRLSGNIHEDCKLLHHVDDQNLMLVNGLMRDEYDEEAERRLADRIHTLGRSVQSSLERGGLDVEWCVDEANRIWVVQARCASDVKQRESRPRQPDATRSWEGTAASPGMSAGSAVFIRSPEARQVEGPYVLILDSSELSDVELFAGASAVISPDMGLLSHTAILARELAIPCVIDAEEAVADVTIGDHLIVDGTAGVIWRSTEIEPPKSAEMTVRCARCGTPVPGPDTYSLEVVLEMAEDAPSEDYAPTGCRSCFDERKILYIPTTWNAQSVSQIAVGQSSNIASLDEESCLLKIVWANGEVIPQLGLRLFAGASTQVNLNAVYVDCSEESPDRTGNHYRLQCEGELTGAQ